MKILLLFFILLFFLSCVEEKKISISGKVVKIGVMAPLSGVYKRFGLQSLDGLLASNKIYPYLENGDKIIFEIIDTNSTSSGAKNALNTLIKNNSKIILSFSVSNNMLSLKEEIQKIDIPIIATLATDNDITNLGNNVYQVCMSNKTQTLVASHYIIDEKFLTNVAVLYTKKSHYSSSLANDFKSYFVNLGGNIKFFKNISSISTNNINKILNSDIDFVYLIADAKSSIEIIEKIHKIDKNIEILGSDGLLSYSLQPHINVAMVLEGVYVVEHYAKPTRNDKKMKLLQSFLMDKSLYGSSYTFLAYDGYKLLIDSLNICKDAISDRCINVVLENSDVVEGIYGNFSMIDAKVKREVYVDKIINSQLHKEIITY